MPNDPGTNWKVHLSKRLGAAGFLFVLLGVIAFVQYHWIGQVAQAERERARANLATALSDFTDEFDMEITRAFATFSQPAEDAADYAGRYQEWKRLAPYPSLIFGVYELDVRNETVKAVGEGEPAIDAAAWRRALKPLVSPVIARSPADVRGSISFASTAGTFSILQRSAAGEESTGFFNAPEVTVVGNPVFVFPIVPMPTASRGSTSFPPIPLSNWLVVALDANYIKATLLPTLAHVHFPTGSTLDYDVVVRTRPKADTPQRTLFRSRPAIAESAFSDPDGSIGLFEIRLHCFSSPADHRGIGGATQVVQPRPRAGARRFRALDTAILRTASGMRLNGMESVSDILGRRTWSCSDSGLTPERRSAGLWQVLVKYRTGSLDGVIAAFRRRSVLLSLGVLLVLAAGVLMLIISTERARALAEMQTDFVLGVSHELRTPLAVIRVAADNLERGMVENADQAQRYGRIIHEQASELSNMIEETLALARMQSAGADNNASASVEQAVNASLERWEAALCDAGVQVQVELDPDLPPVSLNARLLGSCVENLIQNAVKYASVGGWMAIQATRMNRPEGPRVEISVADRGPGIAGSDLPHVFESFYRGKDAAALRTPGVGLGLALVKRVVEGHRGTVEVESSTGKGTRFSIFLPVASCAGIARKAEHTVVHEPANSTR